MVFPPSAASIARNHRRHSRTGRYCSSILFRFFDKPSRARRHAGHATAEAIVRAGLKLVPYTFTGYSAGVAVENVGVSGVPVEVVGAARRQQVMDQVKSEYPDMIIVDYTMPHVVNTNAEFYAANGIPFIVGTTGGDRERMVAAAEAAGVYAIVSPQMGKQVAAFTATVEMMAEKFPGAFKGYSLEVRASPSLVICCCHLYVIVITVVAPSSLAPYLVAPFSSIALLLPTSPKQVTLCTWARTSI